MAKRCTPSLNGSPANWIATRRSSAWQFSLTKITAKHERAYNAVLPLDIHQYSLAVGIDQTSRSNSPGLAGVGLIFIHHFWPLQAAKMQSLNWESMASMSTGKVVPTGLQCCHNGQTIDCHVIQQSSQHLYPAHQESSRPFKTPWIQDQRLPGV